VSEKALLSIAEFGAVREWLAVVANGHEQSGRFLAQTLDQLESLFGELVRSQSAWSADETRARQEWERRTNDLETERAALSAEREQLRQILQIAGSVGSPAPSSEGIELQQMLQDMRCEHGALNEMLASAESQVANLAEATSQLTETREQLRQHMERAGAASSPESASGDDAAAAEQLRGMEQERLVLETELESVRNRAAEMSETLAQQSRQMADERARWADELKRMRQVLEAIAQRQLEQSGVGETNAGAAREPRPPAGKAATGPGAASDPVLDSVMAQFEMLQKDLARRRKAGVKVGTA
jgi:hypothetical protein